MNIILIGFMGSGKSSVGRKLAQELGMKFAETDELVEQAEKMPINEIFTEKGEPYFRRLETQLLKGMQGSDNAVLSTGGGMVLREENVRMLKELGPVVLLWADAETIYRRVKNEAHRPLLKVADPKAEIDKILRARTPIYDKVADFKVDASKLSIEEAVKEIRDWLKSRLT